MMNEVIRLLDTREGRSLLLPAINGASHKWCLSVCGLGIYRASYHRAGLH